MADDSFICGSLDRDFEFLSYPPAPSKDIAPRREVLYLEELQPKPSNSSSSSTLEDDLVTFRCSPLSEEQFNRMFDKEGRIIDEHAFRKAIFRGGVAPSIRRTVWSFLFDFYPCHSTTKEREAILKQRTARFYAIRRRWQTRMLQQFPTFDFRQSDNFIADGRPVYESFANETDPLATGGGCGGGGGGIGGQYGGNMDFLNRDIDQIEAKIYAGRLPCEMEPLLEALRYVSKDVPRTDRTHPYYAGDDNPHLLSLRDALMSFCVVHSQVGYVQGMNDILSRFFLVFDSEPFAFWCFTNYVEKMQQDFLSAGMVHKIEILQQLLKKLDPDLYNYLAESGMPELIFSHKWLLLCFQREFSFDDGLRLLEIVSTHHLELNNSEARRAIESSRRVLMEKGLKFDCGGASVEYTFDLFISVAIMTLYRDEIFNCTDGSQIFQHMSRLSGALNLDQILCQAERLFYTFCRRSVLDSFLLL